MDLLVPKLEESYSKNNRSQNFPVTKWQDCTFVENYTRNVEKAMEIIALTDLDSVVSGTAREVFNKLCNSLCKAMHGSCEKSLNTGTRITHKIPKKWWNKDCSLARNRNKIFHHVWKSSGSPKTGIIYECYKNARKAYRKCCRLAVKSCQSDTYRLVDKLYKERNPKKMWNIIRKSKQSNCYETLNENINIDKLATHFRSKFAANMNKTI